MSPSGGAPQVHWELPPPATGPAPGIEFAPHGARLVAYLLDILVVGLLLALFWSPLALQMPTGTAGSTVEPDPLVLAIAILFAFVGVAVLFLYLPFFWAGAGRTPGMRPFGLYVVRDADGSTFG